MCVGQSRLDTAGKGGIHDSMPTITKAFPSILSKCCALQPQVMQGKSLTMGGMMILRAGTGEPFYRFTERMFGDIAPASEVSGG